MLGLPEIRGPYTVGASTFAIPIHAPQIIGSAKFKDSKKRPPGPALLLDEVVFTVYYPADTSDTSCTRRMNWMIRYDCLILKLCASCDITHFICIYRPVKQSLKGHARFLEMPYWSVVSSLGLFTGQLKVCRTLLPSLNRGIIIHATLCLL